MTEDRMKKWFAVDHLRYPLKEVSLHFAALADTVIDVIPEGPERTVCLRKLLEATDAAMRAMVHPGG